MDLIYDQLMQDYGAVTFEAFINLLVCLVRSVCGLLKPTIRRSTLWRIKHPLRSFANRSVVLLETRCDFLALQCMRVVTEHDFLVAICHRA